MTTDRSLQRLVRRAGGTGRRARRAQRALVHDILRSFSSMERFMHALRVDSYIDEGERVPPHVLFAVLPMDAWKQVAHTLPRPVVDTLCDRATSPDWLELRAFCIDCGLTPGDERRRAVFLCLTGQHARLPTLDPDGALLVAGCAAASPDEQRRIVDAVLEGGNPRLVRALVDDVRRRVITEHGWRLPDPLQEHLMNGLAERQAWPELWDLLKDGPVLRTHDAGLLLGEWLPRAAADRALAQRLTEDEGSDESWEFLSQVSIPPKASDVIVPGGRDEHVAEIVDVSFGPDRPELAVAWRPGDDVDTVCITAVNAYNDALFECRHGQVTTIRVLRLGDSVIVAGDDGITGYRPDESGSMLKDRWWSRPAGSAGLVPLGSGFATDSAGELVIGSADTDTLVRALPAASLGLTGPVLGLASEPGGSRIAVVSATGLAVVDTRGRLVARTEVGRPHRPVGFLGPDCLITLHSDELHRWSTAGGTLRHEAAAVLTEPCTPVALPAYRRLVSVRLNRSGLVHYDADTLDQAPALATPKQVKRPGTLIASPSGRYLAVIPAARPRDGADPDPPRTAGIIQLYDSAHEEIAALINRPMTDMKQADMDRVQLLRSLEHEPFVAEMLDTLHAFLELRFAPDAAPGPSAEPGR